MLNVYQSIRNQIAETGRMRYPALEKIFRMTDEDKADLELNRLALKQVQLRQDLVLPWICSAPLLLENEAISLFTATNPNWKMALPEILTIPEAARIAQVDYLMNATQVRRLMDSLKRPLQ